MPATLRSSAPTRPLSAPVRAVRAVAQAVVSALATWRDRRRSRAALARLDAHLLADIGLTGREAAAEAAKPGWKD